MQWQLCTAFPRSGSVQTLSHLRLWLTGGRTGLTIFPRMRADRSSDRQDGSLAPDRDGVEPTAGFDLTGHKGTFSCCGSSVLCSRPVADVTMASVHPHFV